jgi:hypothetical protein
MQFQKKAGHVAPGYTFMVHEDKDKKTIYLNADGD